MKKLIFIAALSLSGLKGFAQENLRIIYINNSRSTREDVISDVMIEKIGKMFDKIKADNEKFVLYVSNGVNSETTTNTESLDKMMNLITTPNSTSPDQFLDVEKLRSIVYDKMPKVTGNVIFDFFIIGETVGNIPNKPNPVFKLFPSELSALFNNKKVYVTINSPLETTKVKSEELKKALNFYTAEFEQGNVEYTLFAL